MITFLRTYMPVIQRRAERCVKAAEGVLLMGLMASCMFCCMADKSEINPEEKKKANAKQQNHEQIYSYYNSTGSSHGGSQGIRPSLPTASSNNSANPS